MRQSTEPISVDLRIVAVQLDQDARGRPVTRYSLEDEYGCKIGIFNTPINSRLSEELWKSARRNQVR